MLSSMVDEGRGDNAKTVTGVDCMMQGSLTLDTNTHQQRTLDVSYLIVLNFPWTHIKVTYRWLIYSLCTALILNPTKDVQRMGENIKV